MQEKQWLKQAQELQHKKHRDATGLFVAEGTRLVEEAVASGWRIVCCIVERQAANQPRILGIMAKLPPGVPCIVVNESQFTRAADTQHPQGILVILEQRRHAWGQAGGPQEGAMPLYLVLDRLQDPGNVGAAIRIADAVACDAVLCTRGTADLFAAKTVRASMGSLFHLPVYRDLESAEVVAMMRKAGVQLVAATLGQGAVDCFSADFNRSSAIVLGNEGAGIGMLFSEAADSKVVIPIFGRAESLNVATATAVILYEARRQQLAGGRCQPVTDML